MNEKKKDRCDTCDCYECDCEECNCQCHNKEEQLELDLDDWVFTYIYDRQKNYKSNAEISRYK